MIVINPGPSFVELKPFVQLFWFFLGCHISMDSEYDEIITLQVRSNQEGTVFQFKSNQDGNLPLITVLLLVYLLH